MHPTPGVTGKQSQMPVWVRVQLSVHLATAISLGKGMLTQCRDRCLGKRYCLWSRLVAALEGRESANRVMKQCVPEKSYGSREWSALSSWHAVNKITLITAFSAQATQQSLTQLGFGISASEHHSLLFSFFLSPHPSLSLFPIDHNLGTKFH